MISRRKLLGLGLGVPLLGVQPKPPTFTYMLPEYYHQGWVQGSHTIYNRKKVLHHCNDYHTCDWDKTHPFRTKVALSEPS